MIELKRTHLKVSEDRDILTKQIMHVNESSHKINESNKKLNSEIA